MAQIPDPQGRLDLTKGLLDSIKIPPSAPAGFNPVHAEDGELEGYGFPPRPNPQTQSREYANWKRIFNRRLTFVRPEFDVDMEAKKSGNWSGAITTDVTSPDWFRAVFADWIVPNPYPRSSEPDTYVCSNWIGIDGTGGSHDVLQAGTSQRVIVDEDGSETRYIRPWFEWYPAHAVFIKGFAVAAGDTIYCSVWAFNSKTQASVFFMNLGSGDYTSVVFDAPKGTTLKGNSAEWIVEDPSHNHQRYKMARYGTTFFYDCAALTHNWEYRNLSTAETVEMVQGGEVLSEAMIENNTVLRVFSDQA